MLPIQHFSIALVLIYFSLTGLASTLILQQKLTAFMKFMWLFFVWMLPFLGSLGWFFVQSFEYKFKTDGGV